MAKPDDVLVDAFLAKPKFKLFQKVKFLYCFVAKSREPCYEEGIITSVEFCPPNTEVLGWWYKIIAFSNLSNRKKGSIDIIDLGDIIEIEVHQLDIQEPVIKISDDEIFKFKCALLEFRMNVVSNYKIGNNYQIRSKNSSS